MSKSSEKRTSKSRSKITSLKQSFYRRSTQFSLTRSDSLTKAKRTEHSKFYINSLKTSFFFDSRESTISQASSKIVIKASIISITSVSSSSKEELSTESLSFVESIIAFFDFTLDFISSILIISLVNSNSISQTKIRVFKDLRDEKKNSQEFLKNID